MTKLDVGNDALLSSAAAAYSAFAVPKIGSSFESEATEKHATTSNPPRGALALISNSPTPYRSHLHSRIVEGIPELEIFSLFTHDVSNAPWQINSQKDVQSIYFGRGERSADQDRLSRQAREWRKGKAIMRWVRQHHVHAVLLAGYNDLGRLHILSACSRFKIPCFLFGDGNILLDSAHGLKGYAKRCLVGSAVRLSSGVCYCGELGRQYFAKYGAKPDRLFPFPYEPDYDLIRSISPSELDDVRVVHGLRPNRRRFVFSGRLAREKRVDLLIHSFLKVAPERTDWDLVIIGDGPLRTELAGLVPPKFESRIKWIGFVQDSALLSKLYRCCDVLVLPSDFEPWGIVVTEAATCLGLICSSIVGAARDLVVDGINGRLFEKGDSAALSKALLDVSSPGKADEMKARSPEVLAAWRKRSDPVLHLRQALLRTGALS